MVFLFINALPWATFNCDVMQKTPVAIYLMISHGKTECWLSGRLFHFERYATPGTLIPQSFCLHTVFLLLIIRAKVE